MKRPYRLMLRLGNGPYRNLARYATRQRAQQAVDFWNTMHGSVNKEPYHAYIAVKENHESKTYC